MDRCYYQMTKNLIETQHSFSSTFHYYLSCLLIFAFSLRLLYIEYVLYSGFDTILLYYNFFKYDILLSYLCKNPDPFLMITVFLFAMFWIYCEHKLFSLDTTTWQWWYQLVVMSQDRYYQCILPLDVVERIRSKRTELLMKRLLLPQFILQIWARLQVWYHMDDVDHCRLFNKSIFIRPNISKRLRSRIILLLIVADKIALFSQWFTCK